MIILVNSLVLSGFEGAEFVVRWVAESVLILYPSKESRFWIIHDFFLFDPLFDDEMWLLAVRAEVKNFAISGLRVGSEAAKIPR